MEESKDCELMGLVLQDGRIGNHIESDYRVNDAKMSNKNTNQLEFYSVEFSPSHVEVEREKVKKLYSLMSLSMSCIIQEIDNRKRDENKLMYELMWFSHYDKEIERKKQIIKNYEEANEVKPHLPMRSIQRTAGFLQLTKKDAETPVDIGIGRKRCHNRLKKERMDLQYFRQVQEELLSSMKPDERPVHGTQELNDVMVSLVQRVQHSNNTRAEETKILHEIRNLNDTIETYTAPIELFGDDYYRFRSVGGQRGLAISKQRHQHRLKLLSNAIEVMTSNQKAQTAKIKRINAELIHVRKNIKCMERVLEKVYTKRMKAYKYAYNWYEKKEMKLSYSEYQSLMIYVKELARSRDVVGLTQICDEVEEFMREWISNKTLIARRGDDL